MLLLVAQIFLGTAEDDMGLDIDLILENMEDEPELSVCDMIDMSIIEE